MERLPQILICDDDLSFHLVIKHALKSKYECRSAYNGDEALTIIKKYPIDIVLLDVQMRSPQEGLKYIPSFKEADSDLAIIMSSSLTDFTTVREAMRLGAMDYIPKEFHQDELLHTITSVLDRRNLIYQRHQQNFEVLRSQNQHVLVGKSAPMQILCKTIEKVKQSQANVLITGETGTGKEVVARQLRHNFSDGTLAPFVAVDSSTIQSSTAESILFGHEKGAFTGADRTTKGIFEEATDGVVYFDEIANMPLEIQAKLLRVLQEREITRLGSSRVIKLEFRVICATNKNLDELVQQGKFKGDLLQRLNVLPIQAPSLRERKEDISELVHHFVQRHTSPERNLIFTPEALEVMKQYNWPGNVRELSNVVAYLLTMIEGNEIDVCDLPLKFRDISRHIEQQTWQAAEPNAQNFYAQVTAFEKKLLEQEYNRNKGNISKLALDLGMDRSHLYNKLKEYGLHAPKQK